jgi:gluconate 2-dehydrogenase gamma chain
MLATRRSGFIHVAVKSALYRLAMSDSHHGHLRVTKSKLCSHRTIIQPDEKTPQRTDGLQNSSLGLPMAAKHKTSKFSRRTFLEMGAIASAALATGCATRKGGNWEFFTEDEAATLTAICDQIIPADDYPSASQAGVLNYIDKQITRHYRRHQRAYRNGLKRVNQLSQQHCGKTLAATTRAEQLQIVTSLEKSDTSFFNLVRSHTFEGYYGSPRHGGNRNAVSWHMLGLDDPPLRGRSRYDLKKGTPS